MKGKFIVFEGGERVGKSTCLSMLRAYAAENPSAKPCVFTREPGGGEIAERIREIILDGDYLGKISYHTEALLYAAARCQHIDETILPALNAGKNVVCDRYIHSSFAYQGFARGLGYDYIREINSYAVKNCMPDAVIFFDLPPDAAFSRGGETDRMENEKKEFHRAVYEGFEELKKREKNFFPIVPKGIEETFFEVLVKLKGIGFFD
ncbi:MAG: dTMP kinase [Clostridiales bacterium]|jgi:dTMP kinase|nr:dTMP kinase [Clostridiales bacterium]